MIKAILQAVAGLLEEERVPGGRLEGVATVHETDAAPINDDAYPAVTVDWDGAGKLRGSGSQVEASWRYAVSLYVLTRLGALDGDRQLQDLLWREASGRDLGLLPALLEMSGIVIDGKSYTVTVDDDVRTGILREQHRATVGATVTIHVRTMRRRPLP